MKHGQTYMGRPYGTKDGINDTRLRALHRTAVNLGYTGKLIPIKDWHGVIVNFIGMRSRQDLVDKTYAMEVAGLIEHEKRKGVRILPFKDQDGLELEEEPSEPGIQFDEPVALHP